MKVLFLDIDGVCNSKQFAVSPRHRKGSALGIDPFPAFLVGKIQLDTGCEVVLSSSWRHHPESVAIVEEQVVKLLDMTPTLPGGLTAADCGRGKEVCTWLMQHPEVTRYAILDDDSDFFAWQPLFKTTFENGLTEEIAKQVTDYLNEVSE